MLINELIPQDVLTIILSYCTPKDIIQLLRVNKKLHSLRLSQSLWEILLWEKHKLRTSDLKNRGKRS